MPDIIERNAKCARQLLEAGATIERMLALLAYIARRDAERNLFDCPGGGWIRQELKAVLTSTVSSSPSKEQT